MHVGVPLSVTQTTWKIRIIFCVAHLWEWDKQRINRLFNVASSNMRIHTECPEGHCEYSIWREDKWGWRDNNYLLIMKGCHGEDGLNLCLHIKHRKNKLRELGDLAWRASYSVDLQRWDELPCAGANSPSLVLVRWGNWRDARAWLCFPNQSARQSLRGALKL